MRTRYKVGELLHTAALVFAEVRVDIVVICDGIRTARQSLDQRGGVVLRRGMANDTSVPDMRGTEVSDSPQSTGCDSIERAATIDGQRTCVLPRWIVVGECARQKLIDYWFQSYYDGLGLLRIWNLFSLQKYYFFREYASFVPKSPAQNTLEGCPNY